MRRLAFSACTTAASILATSAAAQTTVTLTVDNQTDSYVEVSVDGVHGCHTAAHTACTIPITAGKHHLRAVRDDSGHATQVDGDIEPPGSTWHLSNATGPDENSS
ncbi:MAG TPA: hypothetical protein VN713_06710 [Sphingomicrobium sp.]|nr:hypothetical protein [Sphingomicrobium sp.]